MNEQTVSLPKILLIDDEPVTLQLLHTFLKRQYRVSWATDGIDGLTLAKDTLPDLILLDILLPGMNGFEVCQRLRDDSLTRDIPVIFLTTMAETEDMDEGYQVGGNEYLVKPIDFTELLLRVQQHLGTGKYAGVNFIQKPFLLSDLAQQVREVLDS